MKVAVVLPAYNASKTLAKTYRAIPRAYARLVLLVDDGSSDRTVVVARKLGLPVVTHPMNRGYGGNQKTCFTLALSRGADVVVLLHPDYQYDPTLIPELVRPIVQGRAAVMLGSRIRSRAEALAGGMPLYKYLGNRLLTILENTITGRNLSEYHTGFRAYDRATLTRLPFHRYSDNFVFDQQILLGAIASGAVIGEIAVPVRYFPEASSINFWRSVVYGLSILRDLCVYACFKRRFLR